MEGCLVCEVSGREVSLRTWEPFHGADRDIVWIMLQPFAPVELAYGGVRRAAREVCDMAGTRIVCIDYLALRPVLLLGAAPLAQLRDDVEALVCSLPLRRPFLLVEDSLGVCTPLLWTLRPQLVGAVVLNPRTPASDDFESSAFFQRVRQVEEMLHDFCVARQLDRIKPFIQPNVHTEDAEQFADRFDQWRAAAQAADEGFWAFLCTYLSGPKGGLSGAMQAMLLLREYSALDPPMHVLILSGSSAPTALFHEAAKRLQRLLPGSGVAYLPKSALLWALEGDRRAGQVGTHVRDLALQAWTTPPPQAAPSPRPSPLLIGRPVRPLAEL